MSSFQLPKLSYDYDELEPYIDGNTLSIHHGKHHATYVNNLNVALENY
ncbi:superoxide dismutase, partial [Bacillus safensis]|nr:superoxide dismutase [Bacillus safensis]